MCSVSNLLREYSGALEHLEAEEERSHSGCAQYNPDGSRAQRFLLGELTSRLRLL